MYRLLQGALIAVIIIGSGYLAYSLVIPESDIQEIDTGEMSSIPEGWVLYERKDKNFSFYHPADWTVNILAEYNNLDAPETSINMTIIQNGSEWSGRFGPGYNVSEGIVIRMDIFYTPGNESVKESFDFRHIDNPIRTSISNTEAYYTNDAEKIYYIYNDPYRFRPVVYHDSVDNPTSSRAKSFEHTFDAIVNSISFDK